MADLECFTLVSGEEQYQVIIPRDQVSRLTSDPDYAVEYMAAVKEARALADTHKSLAEPAAEPEKIAEQFKWTIALAKLLIATRRKFRNKFASKAIIKARVWEEVASDVSATSGTTITGTQCDVKWRALLQRYREIVHKLKKKGKNGRTYWQLFEDMDSFMHGRMSSPSPTYWISESLPTIQSSDAEFVPKDVVDAVRNTKVLSITNINNGNTSAELRGAVSTVTWTTALVRLLIAERSKRHKQFASNNIPKIQLWEEVARSITEASGTVMNRTQCDVKWRSLLQRYRLNKDKLKESGIGDISWRFFKDMDMLLGAKTSNRHPPIEEIDGNLLSVSSESQDHDYAVEYSSTDRSPQRDASFANLCRTPRPEVTVETIKWTTALTKLLINERKKLEEKFNSNGVLKAKVWEEVARNATDKSGTALTGPQCDVKWRSLLQRYRKIRETLQKRPNGTSRWEHFKDMDAFLNKKLINGSSSVENLPSSSSAEPTGTKNASTNGDSFHDVLEYNRINLKNMSRKRKSDNEPPLWFAEFMKKRDEERRERWRERKRLEERKIAAFGQLTDVLAKLLDK